MSALLHAVTGEILRDLLQELGFRATFAADARGEPVVRSATNGLAFEIRLGNPAPDGAGALDIRLVAALQVEGALDLALVNAWNNERRFARLHLQDGRLLLDMDVSVAGGVAPAHLAGQIEIWNRLVEALIDHLRRGLAGPAADAPVPSPLSATA